MVRQPGTTLAVHSTSVIAGGMLGGCCAREGWGQARGSVASCQTFSAMAAHSARGCLPRDRGHTHILLPCPRPCVLQYDDGPGGGQQGAAELTLLHNNDWLLLRPQLFHCRCGRSGKGGGRQAWGRCRPLRHPAAGSLSQSVPPPARPPGRRPQAGRRSGRWCGASTRCASTACWRSRCPSSSPGHRSWRCARSCFRSATGCRTCNSEPTNTSSSWPPSG